MSDAEIEKLTFVAFREQGSVDGAKVDDSLMANLAEERGKSDAYSFVGNSGWFGSNGFRGYGSGARYQEFCQNKTAYVNAVKDVLVNGNRAVPKNINEHDCFSDISYATNNGVRINASYRSSYVPGTTVIHNVYGSIYIFYGFASSDGDPFGYIK